MLRPAPAWFVNRAADRHVADVNDFKPPLYHLTNFIRLIETLKDHMQHGFAPE
jgi:hypothetical protein